MEINKKLFQLALLTVGIVLVAQGAVAQSSNASVERKDVSFISRDATLSGTLLIPKGKKITAAIVLVHGSGKQERMTGFAWVFALRGIATLTYDKRGVGQSTGVYAGPEVGTENATPENLNLLADDAATALQILKQDPQLHDVPVGFAGISQAGWIIPIAATKNDGANFIVVWSGPVVTTHEQRKFQNFTHEAVNFWDTHSAAEVRTIMDKPNDYLPFNDTDPRDMLRKLSIPGLWLFGERDSAVPVELSIERLTAITHEKNLKFEYQLFPNYGHSLGNLAKDVVAATVDWINSKVSAITANPPTS